MDLRAVKAASRDELAAAAVAATRNAKDLLDDAELLAGAGRSGRAYACAVLAVEESGKGMNLATLACLPDKWRQRAPLRRMLEWHQMKLARGLIAAVLPFGSVGLRISAMPAGELARTLRSLAPAEESDRLKRAGLYVDIKAGGRISEPPEITASEVARSVGLARQATRSAGGLILASRFPAWLADPPAEALEISEDLVTALTEAGADRTPDAAAEVIRQTVGIYRARRDLAERQPRTAGWSLGPLMRCTASLGDL